MALSDVGKSWSTQRRGTVFVLVVFIVFMEAGLYAARRRTPVDARSVFKTEHPGQQAIAHPIPSLMAEAEDKFRGTLAKQSKTLSAAVKEYKRRYGRDPPKGFDGWWEFAVKNNVKIMDEYDGLVEDLAPFWELSGEELRRRSVQVSAFVSLCLFV